MQVGILITDDGPHPPEAWAEVTANEIIRIGSQSPEALLREADAFKAKLIEILTVHHGRVQAGERGAIQEHGHARLGHDIEPMQHVDEDPVQEIVNAAKGTSFAGHFAKEETQEYLQRLLANHFATAMHIERSYHADRNPRAKEVKAFRDMHHPGA